MGSTSTTASVATVPIHSSTATIAPPASIVSTDISDLSCCYRFWGPFHPICGGHTIEEIATSLLLPTPLVLVYRLVFTIFLLTNLVYFLITKEYSLMHFTVWGLAGLCISFALLSATTLTYLLTPTPKKLQQCNASSPIAFVSIAFFQVFASAALFIDVFYWALLYDAKTDVLDLPTITSHATNFAFVFLEMLLSLNMNFKLIYMFFLPCVLIVYVAFMWIRYAITQNFPYEVFEFDNKQVGEVVLYYVGTLLWSFIAGFVILLLSRVNRISCLSSRFYNRQHTQSHFSHLNNRSSTYNRSNAVISVVGGHSETGNTLTTVAAGDDEGRPFDNMV